MKMAENKTRWTGADVHAFIDAFAHTEQRKRDSAELVRIMQEVTGEAPRMWGPSIIGFGHYHYTYKSGHEGDAPVIGFSPRKAAISLYVYSDTEKSRALLPRLGKHKMAKACIYVNKLSDVDVAILRALCEESIRYIRLHHECSCRAK